MIVMTLRPTLLRHLCIGIGILSTVNALNLSTFSGQAGMRVLMEDVAGQETSMQAKEMLVKANDKPDYTCTANKRCALGCCGPL